MNNKTRSELIKKSKYDFAAEMENIIKDDSIDVEFYQVEKEPTVKVLITSKTTGSVLHVGVAKFKEGETFNIHLGLIIALGKALEKDVSEFENAPQPDGFTVGQVVKVRATEWVKWYVEGEIKSIYRPQKGEDESYYFKNVEILYNHPIVEHKMPFSYDTPCVIPNESLILDDSNAIYDKKEREQYIPLSHV